jgi:Flp pilus assembly pilin Flp
MRTFGALCRFIKEEQGTEALEWALVCGLIVIGSIVAILAIKPKVVAMWGNINASLK